MFSNFETYFLGPVTINEGDLKNLYKALQVIGKDDTLRANLIAECKVIERLLDYPGSIRDDITGPIIDALHSDVGVLRKKLSSGVVFDFYYRSKIARDLVVSSPESPDHVWEPQTTKLLLYLATQAKHVIVGGAYFGDQAILIAKQLTNHGGICHAFEPDPGQSKMLIHNARLNGLDNVRVYQMGLWNDDTTLLNLTGDDACASSEVVTETDEPGMDGNQTFRAITIDSYLREQGIRQVDLIMLDIEGAEYRALQGASQQLNLPAGNAPNIVFEVHRNYVDWTNGLQNTEIVKYLLSFGYKVYAVRDFQSNYDMGNKPIEVIPPESTYLEGPPHGFNMLAVKDVSILQNDQFKFCQNVSPKLLLHKDPLLHHPTDGL